MSSIRELEIEVTEIENELGVLRALIGDEELDYKIEQYNEEIDELETQLFLLEEEIHYLEIEGEN